MHGCGARGMRGAPTPSCPPEGVRPACVNAASTMPLGLLAPLARRAARAATTAAPALRVARSPPPARWQRPPRPQARCSAPRCTVRLSPPHCVCAAFSRRCLRRAHGGDRAGHARRQHAGPAAVAHDLRPGRASPGLPKRRPALRCVALWLQRTHSARARAGRSGPAWVVGCRIARRIRRGLRPLQACTALGCFAP